MRRYVQIDNNTESSVFKLMDGHCCSNNLAPEDIVAQIFKKGSCTADEEPLAEYEFDKLDGNEVTFKWDDDLFELCAGWYILKIMNDCRMCGEHTLKIGRDCKSGYVKSVDRTHANCTGPCDPDENCNTRKIKYCDCKEECDCVCTEGAAPKAKQIITKVIISHD